MSIQYRYRDCRSNNMSFKRRKVEIKPKKNCRKNKTLWRYLFCLIHQNPNEMSRMNATVTLHVSLTMYQSITFNSNMCGIDQLPEHPHWQDFHSIGKWVEVDILAWCWDSTPVAMMITCCPVNWWIINSRNLDTLNVVMHVLTMRSMSLCWPSRAQIWNQRRFLQEVRIRICLLLMKLNLWTWFWTLLSPQLSLSSFYLCSRMLHLQHFQTSSYIICYGDISNIFNKHLQTDEPQTMLCNTMELGPRQIR